jgi:6,7-dimethyl-8-ribityllumazine synthase
MSEPTDESQDWPLRDYSQRLRPPGRTDEPLLDEPELPPPPTSEPEILYDEDELEEDPEALVEIEEHAVPVVAPPAEEPESPAEEPESPAEEPESPAEEPSAEEPPAPPEEHAAGDFRVPDGYQALEGAPDGTRRAVAVVISRYNGEITNRLLESALGALDEAGVARDAILIVPVPGAFELPLAAMALAKTRRYSCVVALGAVIRGETPHFDFVASEAASGLQLAGIETGVPVSFGLLTTDTAEQAEARVERGAWAARTALEMADVFAKLRASTR